MVLTCLFLNIDIQHRIKQHSAIGFGRTNETFANNKEPSSPSVSKESDKSTDTFFMSKQNMFGDTDTDKWRQPTTDFSQLSFDNNNSSEFTGFDDNIYIGDKERDSMTFNGEEISNSVLPKSPNDISEENDYKVAIGLQRKLSSRIRKKSLLKRDFMRLQEEDQWSKVIMRLNKVFNDNVSASLRQYAIDEEFDFQSILDDIEDYPDDVDDESNIMQHLQSTFNWDKKECDRFYRTTRRILMDRKTRRVSLTGFNDLLNVTGNEMRKMEIKDFAAKWSDVIDKLKQYCHEEEYDLEAIMEDLETFEEENSLIVEEISKNYGWDENKKRLFVDDFKALIMSNPVQVRRQFSVIDDDDDDD